MWAHLHVVSCELHLLPCKCMWGLTFHCSNTIQSHMVKDMRPGILASLDPPLHYVGWDCSGGCTPCSRPTSSYTFSSQHPISLLLSDMQVKKPCPLPTSSCWVQTQPLVGRRSWSKATLHTFAKQATLLWTMALPTGLQKQQIISLHAAVEVGAVASCSSRAQQCRCLKQIVTRARSCRYAERMGLGRCWHNVYMDKSLHSFQAVQHQPHDSNNA